MFLLLLVVLIIFAVVLPDFTFFSYLFREGTLFLLARGVPIENNTEDTVTLHCDSGRRTP